MSPRVSATTLLTGGAAFAEDVTLQLKWVTQSQFGGYYVAKDKGFYEEEGLDVTIKPGGPDIAPEQVITVSARLASCMNWVAFCDSSENSTPRALARMPIG